jgi:hypothetical protein
MSRSTRLWSAEDPLIPACPDAFNGCEYGEYEEFGGGPYHVTCGRTPENCPLLKILAARTIVSQTEQVESD